MVVTRKSNFHLRSDLQVSHLKDLGLNGKTIFKMVLKNRMGGQRRDLFALSKDKWLPVVNTIMKYKILESL
jgi:hypothetical protein